MIAAFDAPLWAARSGTQELPATGRGAAGTALPLGATDPRWQATPAGQGAPDGSATPPSAWGPATVGSWAAALASPSSAALAGPAAPFSWMLFRATFNASLAAPSLSLRYSADDSALVYFNGALVANDTAPPFGCGQAFGAAYPCATGSTCCWLGWQHLTLNAGWVNGTNTLMFAVTNFGGGSGVFVVPAGPPVDLAAGAPAGPASTGLSEGGVMLAAPSGTPDASSAWCSVSSAPGRRSERGTYATWRVQKGGGARTAGAR